jgi:hypothetical protein
MLEYCLLLAGALALVVVAVFALGPVLEDLF